MSDSSTKSRLDSKDDLMMKLGALYAPLENFVLSGSQNEEEKIEVCGRFRGEINALLSEVTRFCRPRQYVYYDAAFDRFASVYNFMIPRFTQGDLQTAVEQKSKFSEAIRSIPAKAETRIMEAETPFTAYIYIKSICENNSLSSLVLVDAWMGQEVFHRYLRWVDSSVKVTLVTKEPTAVKGRDRDR